MVACAQNVLEGRTFFGKPREAGWYGLYPDRLVNKIEKPEFSIAD